MDQPKNNTTAAPLQRQLAGLKLISRLLGHELHVQGAARAISLSRDEVLEIQTTIDLFIEEVTRSQGGPSSAGGYGAPETRLVGTRN